MVQASHLGQRNNLPFLRSPYRTRIRGILLQTQMRATPVVIRQIGLEQTSQVSLIEHDDMVQAFAADRTDQSPYMEG